MCWESEQWVWTVCAHLGGAHCNSIVHVQDLAAVGVDCRVNGLDILVHLELCDLQDFPLDEKLYALVALYGSQQSTVCAHAFARFHQQTQRNAPRSEVRQMLFMLRAERVFGRTEPTLKRKPITLTSPPFSWTVCVSSGYLLPLVVSSKEEWKWIWKTF